jgi:hypothetical protein
MNGIDLMRQQVAMIEQEATDKAFAMIQKKKDEALERLQNFYPAMMADPNIVTGIACARDWHSVCVILNDQYGWVAQGSAGGLVISMFHVTPGENYSIDPWVTLPVRRPSYLLREGMTDRDHAIEFNKMLTDLEAN